MEASEATQDKQEPSMLQQIRNMWEFAAVMQYIFMFGKAVRIDEDFDIEVRHMTTAPSFTTSNDDGGAVLMIGMANLMITGLRK